MNENTELNALYRQYEDEKQRLELYGHVSILTYEEWLDLKQKKDMKILDLVLKHKWYDMIESGKKTEEYRELKPYWAKRIERHYYTHVRFHRGYTSTTMTFEIKDIREGLGNPNWGAPNEEVFIIKLGKRI